MFYSNHYTNSTFSQKSDSVFVPIKTPEHGGGERSSGTESDDSSVRSVRFSKLAEVKHMSESDATEALLARLSYQASARAGEVARRQANKFPVRKVAGIAFTFCFLVRGQAKLKKKPSSTSEDSRESFSCSGSRRTTRSRCRSRRRRPA